MQRYLTLLLFMIIPSMFLRAYVELSFYIYIMSMRSKIKEESDIDIESVNKLLSLTYNENSIVLPYKTYNWVWNKDIANEVVIIDNKALHMGEILTNKQLVVTHAQFLTDYFLDKLPKAVSAKLCRLSGPTIDDRLNFKHAITRVLVYS